MWQESCRARIAVLALGVPAFAAGPACAIEIDGRDLSPAFGLPFAGLLLAIALVPLAAPRAWDHRQGTIAASFALLAVIPLALALGPGVAADAVLAVLVHEYLPFVLLLTALFTVAGGIRVRGNLHGSPAVNAGLLLVGTGLAGEIGTTGAAMLLIRPLMRANDARRHTIHVVVFFIILVANLGGALSPLGDPPLFLGFLRGVAFSWPLLHLAAPTLVAVSLVLAAFVALDVWLYRRDRAFRPLPDPTPGSAVSVTGWPNVALLAGVVGATALSGVWKPGVTFTVGGVDLGLEALVRDLTYLGAAAASLALTPARERRANGFTWAPLVEVARLFAGIFVCLIPVAAMLRAGAAGPFAPLVALASRADGTPSPAAYFWLTGGLSALLDNAPTYLVFFELAGGDAARLMTRDAPILAAISCGAVFMGALTPIGNAPNLMVAAIARAGGVAMPGFLGYLAWSVAVLVPTFLVVTVLFFR